MQVGVFANAMVAEKTARAPDLKASFGVPSITPCRENRFRNG